MSTYRFFCRKLARLKRLARLVNRPPAIAKLDKLWGFSSQDHVPRRRKKSKPRVKKEPTKHLLDCFDKKYPESREEPAESESSKPVEDSLEEDQNYQYVKEREFFKESVKDLRKLVYPHLDPISKRHFDEMKLIALGGKVARNRKMPYKEFLQRQKALKRHLDKHKKLEDELGVKFTLDKKGGSRFAEIHKRKESREKRKRKPLFDSSDRDGIYRIKL